MSNGSKVNLSAILIVIATGFVTAFAGVIITFVADIRSELTELKTKVEERTVDSADEIDKLRQSVDEGMQIIRSSESRISELEEDYNKIAEISLRADKAAEGAHQRINILADKYPRYPVPR